MSGNGTIQPLLDAFGLPGGFSPSVESVGDFIFYKLILDHLRDAITEFGIRLLGNMTAWVGGIALTLMTLWVLIQGYRIVTGQSRESMMALVNNMARATFIISMATTLGMVGSDLHSFLNEDLKNEIALVVTGEDTSPEEQIDKSLGWMQVALSSIDALDVMSNPTIDDDKNRAMWFAGLGTGGPAVTGGAMLLLYEIALALFIGLGPLFILCLLFDQTKALFQRWLLYGIGTMFSMAVLAAMVSISLEMVTRVASAFWASAAAGALLGSDFSDGITSQAMQQGGMGLILTTLIITAPPMAASFFQGTLGNFMHFSAFATGSSGRPGPQGQPPGSYGVLGREAGHSTEALQFPAGNIAPRPLVSPHRQETSAEVVKRAGERGPIV